MSKLEEYLKQPKQQELNTDQEEEQFLFRTETVDISDYEVVYPTVYDKQRDLGIGADAEEPELAAYYVKENIKQKLSQASFVERTEYYFQDPKYMEAKKDRYKSLAAKDNDELDKYAQKHTNRSATKRRSKANDAADCFEKAGKLEEKLVKREEEAAAKAKPMNTLELYKAREEIMRVRMEGMIAAAKAKSTSDKNEGYRIAKAKVSCLSVLMDQANMLKKHNNDEAAFIKIEKGLQKEMSEAEKQLSKYAPDINEQWQESLGLKDENVMKEKLKKAQEVIPSATEEDVKLQTVMHSLMYTDSPEVQEAINKANEAHAFPKTITNRGDEIVCVYNYSKRDRNGVPINKEELKKEEWNKHWTQVAIDPTRNLERKQLLIEAYQRYENFEFPTPEELHEKGIMGVFMEDPAKIMGIIRNGIGLDDIRKNGEPFVEDMRITHPVLRKKLEMGKFLGFMFKDANLNLHGIVEAGLYSFDKSGRYVNLKDQDEEDRENFYDLIKQYEEQYKAVYDEVMALQEAREDNKRKIAQSGEKVATLEEFKKDPYNVSPDDHPFFAGAEEGHKVYLDWTGVNMVMQNPYYMECYKRAEKKIRTDISRFLGVMLRDCKFDKNWIPVTQKDMDAHLWNLKVLKNIDIAILGREIEEEEKRSLKMGVLKLYPEQEKALQDECRGTIVQMGKEEIDRIYGNMTNFPTPDELRKQFLEPMKSNAKELNVTSLEKYLKNPGFYAEIGNHSNALEVFVKEFPELDDYWKEHPEYEARFNAHRELGGVLDMYSTIKYHLSVDVGGGNTTIRKGEANPDILAILINNYEDEYNKLQ